MYLFSGLFTETLLWSRTPDTQSDSQCIEECAPCWSLWVILISTTVCHYCAGGTTVARQWIRYLTHWGELNRNAVKSPSTELSFLKPAPVQVSIKLISSAYAISLNPWVTLSNLYLPSPVLSAYSRYLPAYQVLSQFTPNCSDEHLPPR